MRAGARNGIGRSVAVLLSLASLGGGCGYTSKYSPPRDGRARAVWQGNKTVMDLAGAPSDACVDEVARVTGQGRLALVPPQASDPVVMSGGYWVPRYWGPRIVVVSPRFAPPLSVAPAFMPRPVTIPAPGMAKGFVGTGGGGGGGIRLGSGGGGGGGNMGKAVVALAVIALIVLPAVDIGVALADPEDAKASSRGIDQVNAYNDLARWPGSPCDYAPSMYAPPGPDPVPVPVPGPVPGYEGQVGGAP